MSVTVNDTSDRIVEAALTVLARYGPQKLSMSDVGRQAGVSRGTLYRYFKNKTDILEAASLYVEQRCESELAEAIAGEPSLDRRVSVVLDALVRFPDLFPATKLILEHEPAFTLAFVRGVTPRFVELVGDALEPAADRIPAITAAGLTVAELAEIFVRTTSSSYFLPGEHTGEISLWLQRLSGATQALESP
jgi:AcrR family transcriptional regulator